MLTLAINTASSKTAIAILCESEESEGNDRETIDEKSWPAQNNESEKLLPAIDALLKANGLAFPDIGRVVVVRGPGSFTGLRVGVTVANTLAYLNGAELYGISTFEYWHTVYADLPLLVYAGSGGVYLSMGACENPEILNLDEARTVLRQRKISKIFGDISEEQKKVLCDDDWTGGGCEFVETLESFGRIISAIDFSGLQAVKIVEPLYVKEPGITASKKF